MANGAYHGLELSADKRMSRNFSFKGYYAFGKGLEDYDMQSGTRDYPQNSSKFKMDRGRTSNDLTHRFVMSGIWQIDYLRGAHPVLRTAVNGWTVSTIVSFLSGSPLTITAGDDINRDGQSNDRADLIGDPRLDSDRPRSETLAKWFNTAAFVRPAFGSDGNAGRNILDGPGRKHREPGHFPELPDPRSHEAAVAGGGDKRAQQSELEQPVHGLNFVDFRADPIGSQHA